MSWLLFKCHFLQSTNYNPDDTRISVPDSSGLSKFCSEMKIITPAYYSYALCVKCARQPHTDLNFDNSFCTALWIVVIMRL